MAHVIVVFILVLLEVFMILVDCVISKMHIQIIKILVIWLFVRHSCKSCQSIFIEIYSEWVHAQDQNIDSKIILELVDFMWLV